eukprot:TRINITY_DN46115_c0_g1_i1.p1 TRINITY_DN46115_c0_g1~~TRINITY_DN46115_c0_g1_i1.p1  ORF type:complete len:230 (-),score=34.47 TRINITY_DN46115_c0_g1_i1:57-746(-)
MESAMDASSPSQMSASLRTPSGGEYLPHPYPLKRIPAGSGGLGHGFKCMQESEPRPMQPFLSYGAWWEARQPKPGPKPDKVNRRATSYWPFGPGNSQLVGSENKADGFWLDQRWVDHSIPFTGEISPAATWGTNRSASIGVRRATSCAELLGSGFENEVVANGSLNRLGRPRRPRSQGMMVMLPEPPAGGIDLQVPLARSVSQISPADVRRGPHGQHAGLVAELNVPRR